MVASDAVLDRLSLILLVFLVSGGVGLAFGVPSRRRYAAISRWQEMSELRNEPSKRAINGVRMQGWKWLPMSR